MQEPGRETWGGKASLAGLVGYDDMSRARTKQNTRRRVGGLGQRTQKGSREREADAGGGGATTKPTLGDGEAERDQQLGSRPDWRALRRKPPGNVSSNPETRRTVGRRSWSTTDRLAYLTAEDVRARLTRPGVQSRVPGTRRSRGRVRGASRGPKRLGRSALRCGTLKGGWAMYNGRADVARREAGSG